MDDDLKVFPEMNEAWCAFEPIGQFKETMSFARFNGMLRHAFMSGYIAGRKEGFIVPPVDGKAE